MNEIMPCPACGSIHRPLAPENPYATQIIGDGPKMTWDEFSEDDREVTVFQVVCTNCDFQGPHAEQRRQARPLGTPMRDLSKKSRSRKSS